MAGAVARAYARAARTAQSPMGDSAPALVGADRGMGSVCGAHGLSMDVSLSLHTQRVTDISNSQLPPTHILVILVLA